jgi:hypothetical protein
VGPYLTSEVGRLLPEVGHPGLVVPVVHADLINELVRSPLLWLSRGGASFREHCLATLGACPLCLAALGLVRLSVLKLQNNGRAGRRLGL